MSVIDAAIDDIVSPADYPARAAPPSAVEDASLALSVSTWGVLKPVLLRQCGNGLVLIDGARRLAAARAAGRNEVPAKIFAADDPISDATVRATEMLRAPIHPVDRWRSIKQLMDSGLTLDRAADTLGVDHRAARRLLRLGSIIPPILHEIAVQNRGPNESQLRTIAQAPEKVQKAAWRVHRNATQRGMWFDLAGACGVTRALRRNARFDDEAAARRGIVWEEDLFAPADQDSRHTTDLTAFRLAQQEWMEAEVLGLIGLGYQAEVLPPGPHGMAAMPKGMEVHLGDEKNAGKAVIRGYWMDGQALVRLHLYKRPKPAADNAAKPDGKPAPGGAPAPTEAKPPRGISKKGLVLIAEAKEAAVRGRLAELEVEASASNAITLLNALLVALAGSNVQIGTTRFGRADMREIAAGIVETEPTLADLVARAGTALALMLHAPRPEASGSGDAFNQAARVLEAKPPRCDTPEILAETPKAQLAALARTVPGVKASAAAKVLAEALAGQLADWLPAAADFRGAESAPLAAEDREQLEDAA